MNVDKHTRRTHNKMDSSQTEQKTNKNMDSSHTEQKTNKTTASTINNIRLHARPPPGDTIHVDLKHMPVSMDNNQYLCMFTDAATRVSTPIALRTKDSFKTHYEDYLQFVHNQTGRYPKHIISDGGGEFIDLEVKDINNKHGITHTFTSPHSSAQNSVAERPNRTVSEGSISLLLAANLSASFWEYSVMFFIYVKNRSPHKHLNMSNPLTEWNIHNSTRTHIDLYELRMFGHEAFVLDETHKKNDPKAFRCIYLGPSRDHKGSTFYNLHTQRVITSRNYIINEQHKPGLELYPKLYDQYLGPPTQPKFSTDSVTHTKLHRIHSDKQVPKDSIFDLCVPDSDLHSTSTSNTDTYIDISDNILTDMTHTSQSSGVDLPRASKRRDEGQCVHQDSPQDSQDPQDFQDQDSPQDPQDSQDPQDFQDSDPATKSSSELADDQSICLHCNQYLLTKNLHRHYKTCKGPSSATADDPAPTAYEVVKIHGKRKTRFGSKLMPKDGYDYLVEWKGFTEYTWEPEANLSQARKAIDAFNKSSQSSTTRRTTRSRAMVNFAYFAPMTLLCYLAGMVPTLSSKATWKNIQTPQSDREMFASPEKEHWLAAREEEMKRLIKMKTWTRVKTARKKPLTCRWVYKLKPPTSLQPEPIYKARLVVHGYKQKAEVDFTSTFAQVATFKALRILLWVATIFGYKCTQLDVKSAFLYGKIDKEIYMQPPPGYEHIGPVILNRSLYGLRQAPKIWYDTLISEFHALGFTETVSDSCVFKHATEKFYILIWVDDIILITKNESLRQKIISHLQNKFDLKDLGILRHFCGLQIEYDRNGTHIHQGDYAEKLIDTFDDNDIISHIPYLQHKITSDDQPTTDIKERKHMEQYPYRQLIGSLLYLLITRPELYFIVITLSRFVTNPGFAHWTAALLVLRYVKFTSTNGLTISVSDPIKLTIYCDSDWGNSIDGKSTSGYIIYLGSFPVVWRSRKQKGKAATSSCEAEYRALSNVLDEIAWILSFTRELGISLPTPVKIYCDNKSAKDLSENPVHHDRTKHINIRYHRIREFILDGTVEVCYVPTTENPADVFTKCVTGSVFKYLLKFIYPL